MSSWSHVVKLHELARGPLTVRLEPDAAGANVELLAQAAVEFNRPRRTANRSFQIAKPITARTVAGQVAATSDAVGELTDGLAALLAQ